MTVTSSCPTVLRTNVLAVGVSLLGVVWFAVDPPTVPDDQDLESIAEAGFKEEAMRESGEIWYVACVVGI